MLQYWSHADWAPDTNHLLDNCLLGRWWLGQGGGGGTLRWEGEKPPEPSSASRSEMNSVCGFSKQEKREFCTRNKTTLAHQSWLNWTVNTVRLCIDKETLSCALILTPFCHHAIIPWYMVILLNNSDERIHVFNICLYYMEMEKPFRWYFLWYHSRFPRYRHLTVFVTSSTRRNWAF